MTDIKSMTQEEITDALKAMGESAFRGKQVFFWLHKGARSFDEMSNLSKTLREKLAAEFYITAPTVARKQISRLDGTVKYLWELADGNCIETVLMSYHHGNTVCISSQVGCRMGCKFCASTLEGCVRNLTAGEILGQILAVNRMIKDENPEEYGIHNVVLMGSGEPLDNYDEVIRFLRLLRMPEGLNISPRNVSLSTCGLVPKMYDLANEDLPVTLSVSLHAPNDEIRKTMMPIANAYAMEDVLKACRNYIEKTGRRVIFEYALVKGVNCSDECADELAAKLRGMQCHVNVIPLNDVKERSLEGPTNDMVNGFLARLEKRHISATRRREMGDDIQGACGQLRRSRIRKDEGENK